MNLEHTPNSDATMYAGVAYQSLRAVDGTMVSHPAYQSMLGAPAREPEPEPYAISDKIAGRYEVLAIHRGSMGVVYGTFDHEEKLPRAIKTLQRRFASDRKMQDLFREEAALWVRLEKHPFIVRAYLVKKIDAQPYVITEYIRGQAGMGGDLRAWLGHPKLTLPVAIEMALQIAQGMQHATRKVPGMVHRDLKPANVLVDDRGRAMVTDFGLVCVADSSAGTPAYMAPEQWQGLSVEPRTDIYAFGCILYEMFTGHRMFPAESIQDWKTAHLSLTPVSPRTLNSAIPAELESLVLRCTAKDVLNRPNGWDILVTEFARWFHQFTGQPAVLEFSAFDLTLNELIDSSYSLFSLGRYLDSAAVCDRALEIDPYSAVAWSNKGTTLQMLGRREEALVALDRGLTIDSRNPLAWKSKGETLLEMGRLEEAMAAIECALAIDPNHANAWLSKGVALSFLDRREEALVAIDRALAINPNDADAWFMKGVMFDDLGRREEAVVTYDRVLTINQNYALAWEYKGVILDAMGHLEEALAAYDHALAINPNSVSAKEKRSVVQAALNFPR